MPPIKEDPGMHITCRMVTFEEALARRDEIRRLMDQMTTIKWPMPPEQFERAYEESDVKIYGAFDGEKIVGIATLHQTHRVTRSESFLKEVVVDEPYRRRGIGRRLVYLARGDAKIDGSFLVELTCRADDEVANAFYKNIGFEAQEKTRVYRFKL